MSNEIRLVNLAKQSILSNQCNKQLLCKCSVNRNHSRYQTIQFQQQWQCLNLCLWKPATVHRYHLDNCRLNYLDHTHNIDLDLNHPEKVLNSLANCENTSIRCIHIVASFWHLLWARHLIEDFLDGKNEIFILFNVLVWVLVYQNKNNWKNVLSTFVMPQPVTVKFTSGCSSFKSVCKHAGDTPLTNWILFLTRIKAMSCFLVIEE